MLSVIENHCKATLQKEILLAIKLYDRHGFNVINIPADMGFECMSNEFLSTKLNLTLKMHMLVK